MKYEVIESPTNGTTGQNIGTFEHTDLPASFRAVIEQNEPGEWTFPALSDGDSGAELPDLKVIVRSVREDVIQEGVYAGMTLAEVMADRDQYNRLCGE